MLTLWVVMKDINYLATTESE